MNGATSLLETAAAAGVRACFANPGTTELPLVRALDAAPAIRPVLGLFEGVCTGAADGYARVTGRPALTLLHLGPGFANGLANLHNARRAGSPVVNLIGDQATWHLPLDAGLTSDIASLARPMSGWVRTATAAESLAQDGADAIAAALTGKVATLIVPADCQWGRGGEPVAPPAAPVPERVPEDRVEEAAKALAADGPAVLLLGGAALTPQALRAAARIAAATGCRLMTETFPARMDRGGDLPAPGRLPYLPEMAAGALDGTRTLVLAGAREPVSFFGYQGVPPRLAPEGATIAPLVAAPQDGFENATDALERLADRIGAPLAVPHTYQAPPERPAGALTTATLGAAVAAAQPEGAIVVEEAATSGMEYVALGAGAAPHLLIGHVGGAIGQGLPIATGAAVAAPDRPVIALQADGSGMYTVQSLWTMAREGLDVTVVVCANRSYRILQIELARAGGQPAEGAAGPLLDLGRPALRWTRLAEGMGVPARTATTADDLNSALDEALQDPGPHLIEALLP